MTALGWASIVLLIAGNALFVAAEFALTAVDSATVARLAEGGDRRAARVVAARDELSFHLSGAQLGITVCSLVLGLVAEPVIATSLTSPLTALGLPPLGVESVAVSLALVLATLVQMVFGELVPQNLAISRPLRTALAIVSFQRAFSGVLRPVIDVFNRTANVIVRRLGVEPQEELRIARTPRELSSLIGASADEGVLPPEVARLLRRSLAFGRKSASEVMTPRVRIRALRHDQSLLDLLELARATGHSRFPVYRDDLDDIVGMTHVKQAFGVPADQRASTTVGSLMIEPVRVPETVRCEVLLSTLRLHGLQLALVMDEYGGVAGVVTVEDLVEELVGQVRDEYDVTEVPEVIDLSDGSWSVAGLLRCSELSQLVNFPIARGPFDTVAGLVLHEAGQLPAEGQMVTFEGWSLIVTRMIGHRIDRVRVHGPEVAS